MEKNFHNIMLMIDSSDFDVEDYFKWTEEEKQELVDRIHLIMLPVFRMGGDYAHRLIFNLKEERHRAEMAEDYVLADVMNRCLQEIEKKYL
jgi:hypothetical protein